MISRRLAQLRGQHGMMLVLMMVLFFAVNMCYGISIIKERESQEDFINEIRNANEIDIITVFSAERPYGKDSWTQGFTVTGKYFVIVSNRSDGDNLMTAYSKKTNKKVLSVKCNLGHGNDITFNKNTNEIVVLDGKNGNTIKFFDADTLEEKPKRSISLGSDFVPANRANAIAYDSDLDQYHIVSPKDGGRIFKGDFTDTQQVFDTSTPFNLTQTLSYHGGFVYLAKGCHVRKNDCISVNEDELKDIGANNESYPPATSALIAYNVKTGAREETFLVPPLDKSGKYYGELEGASIDGKNNIYFLYNSYGNDYSSIGNEGSFVIFRLDPNSKKIGNTRLSNMLQTKVMIEKKKKVFNDSVMPLGKVTF